eukprot:3542376-Alexandrium_andersonii.AAC.1
MAWPLPRRTAPRRSAWLGACASCSRVWCRVLGCPGVCVRVLVPRVAVSYTHLTLPTICSV